MRDKAGRPIVVVTGSGLVTSLGAGKVDNWKRLTAGESGIRAITRFATDSLKTQSPAPSISSRIEPDSAPDLAERLAEFAIEEAIAQAGIGSRGRFPGPLFLAVAPIEIDWPQREALARASGANGSTSAMTTCCAPPRPAAIVAILSASCSARSAKALAATFGTEGSPISLSTACASGASAIQLGLEAIRRGETDAALCVATDGSVNPESLVRFSLLSALSVQNDPPQAAAKPFSKNRDGFVMAEGAGAMVLESYERRSRARRGYPRRHRRLRRARRQLPPHPVESRTASRSSAA